MYRKAGSRALLLILIVGVVLCTASLALADGAHESASLKLSPPSNEVAPGDTFTINVLINTSVPVFAAQYTVLFDPAVLDVVNQTQGSFLTSDDNNSTVLINRYNNANGTVEYGETRIKPAGGNATGITGNGTRRSLPMLMPLQ